MPLFNKRKLKEKNIQTTTIVKIDNIHRSSNFVCRQWGFISIYRPLSSPIKFLGNKGYNVPCSFMLFSSQRYTYSNLKCIIFTRVGSG